MRSFIREAVVRIARRRKIAPNDTWAWSEITIRDVIREADISIGTFYKYFEDRADLAQTLWSEPVDRLRADMQVAFDAVDSPTEKLRILLRGYAGFAISDPNLFTHIFLSVPAGQYRETGEIDLSDEPFFRNLCAAFELGQRSGEFRTFDQREMAQLFWAAIHGCLALPINLDRYRFDDTEALSSNMIEALITMVLNESD